MKYRVNTLLTFAFLIAALGANTGAAEKSDFLVNDDGGVTSQTTPRIAKAGDQGFAVVWVDRRLGNSDIYLQRFDADGDAVGSNTKINDDAASAYQSEPSIAGDLFGRYAAVWKDYRNGSYPFGPDIFLQRYDSVLTPIGANADATPTSPDSLKQCPDVAVGKSGAGLVVWSDYRNRHWDIYGQIFLSDGSLYGQEFKINDDAGIYQQHSPRVAVSSQGWFIVTWYDNRVGSDDIFIQRLDSLGTAIGVNILVNSDTGGKRQAFPDVAIDPAGNFTVAWIDWRNGAYPANPDIYARTYDSLLAPLGGEVQVNTDVPTTALRKPAISVDLTGRMIVAWSDSSSSTWDVVGQMINPGGSLSGSNFTLSSSTEYNQIDPDIAVDGEYRYVTWSDNRNGNWDTYASIVRYNEPSLAFNPTSLNFFMREGGSLPSAVDVSISHSGSTPVDFSLTSTVDWLTAAPLSGTTVDTVSVSVTDDALTEGTYFGSLIATNDATGDSSVDLSVRLDVLDLTDDTITVVPTVVEESQSGSTPILGNVTNNATEVSLPLQYVIGDLTIDSVTAGPTLPADISISSTIDSDNGLVAIEWQADSTFTPGDYYLADLHFTAGGTPKSTTIDTVINDSLAAVVTAHTIELTPIFYSGEITISAATAVGGDENGTLPQKYALAQNVPNPFNLATSITYDLPRNSKVTLEVYNVLGQKVRVLFSGDRQAGTHQASWDGRGDDNRVAPTGVYFYRLRTGSISLVRKMILLK